MAKRKNEGERIEPNKTGAPPFVWTEEIENEILDQIMEGKSFRDFMVKDRNPHLPSVPTFFKHLRDDDRFAKRYARAREFQADQEFEEMKEIAADGRNDWMEVNDPDNPGYRLNGEHVQRSKLRVDVLKFRVVKLSPKKYGERVELEHSGEVKTSGEMDMSKLSTDDLLTLRSIQAKAVPDAPSVD